MEEITIKVNKTVLFVVAALIVGFGFGFGSAKVNIKKLFASESGNPALQGDLAANQPAGGAVAGPSVTLTAADHIRGSKNAQVAVVEYSDFQCPYCQKHYPTMKRLIQEYGDKVAWVYRHYPLSFHANAQIAAEGSECAAEQGKFWEFADILTAKGQGDGTGLTPPDLEQYAKNLGLNFSQFKSCLADKKYAARVNTDMASALAAGVDGTPANIILDKSGKTNLVAGAVPYEQLKAAIDAALK